MSNALDLNDSWSVFLPLKQFETGKSRLKTIPTELRLSLIKAMASDLIDALLKVRQIALITVVGVDHKLVYSSDNPKLKSFAITQAVDINTDLALAISNEKRVAIFLPDLPGVSGGEITRSLELAAENARSFITDRTELGTTAFFSTVGKVPTYFGIDSAAKHQATGAVKLTDLTFQGIKADCDDWADLLAIKASDLGVATKSLLEHHLQN